MTNLALRVACALVAVAAALCARGQGQVELRPVDGVTATVTSPWPSAVPRGYVPVFVELRNDTGRAVTAELSIGSSYRTPNFVTNGAAAAVDLAPGEVRELELLLPCHRVVQTTQMVRVAVGARQSSTSLPSADGEIEPQDRLLAWVTPRDLAAGEIERLADAFDRADPTLASRSPSPPVSVRGGYWGGGTRPPRWTGFEVLHASLPSRAAAWSAVDVVVVDAREGAAAPAGPAAAALASYARQGGAVVVLGARAALDGLFGASEDLQPAAARPFGEDGSQWAFGFGVVARLPWAAAEVGEAVDLAAVAELARRAHGTPAGTFQPGGIFQPGTGARLERSGVLEIPGLGRLPMHVFVVILLVFALLIGPINLVVLKRLGRPGLLLVTIPAISFVTSALVLGFGVLHQGLDLKAAAQSLTLLDQREGRAVTLARLAFAPGLAPGDLVPARGTTVHPTCYAEDGGGRELVVRHADGLRLSGGWTPVRTLSNLLTASDAPARARVGFTRTPAGLEVFNGLEVPLSALTVWDGEGRPYSLPSDAPLAPGARAIATASAPPAQVFQPGGEGDRDDALSALGQRVPLARPGTYAALLAESPFIDWLGLEPNLRSQRHVLVGVLPRAESEWNQ